MKDSQPNILICYLTNYQIFKNNYNIMHFSDIFVFILINQHPERLIKGHILFCC